MERIERDSFGEKTIIKDRLYGIQTVRAYENLSFSPYSVSSFPEYIIALAQVKLACAYTNMQENLISEQFYQVIEQVCHEIVNGQHRDHFIVDMLHGGGGIGFNMNMNEVIANRANQILGYEIGSYYPISPVNHVNASQSTADVIYTSARIAIIEKFKVFDLVLNNLMNCISEKKAELQNVETIARTCMQDAMSTTFGDFLSGYSSLIERRSNYLKDSIEQLHFINIGGTVIGSGTGNTVSYRTNILENLNKIIGIKLKHRSNFFDAAQNSDDLMQVSCQIELLAKALLKISKDLRLLSSGPEAGFGELVLPSTQAGSSFFPGKVNPIIPETMMHCVFQVIGGARATAAVFEHGELNLNVFEGVAYFNIMQSLDMLTVCVHHFIELCILDITVNEEKCHAHANSFIPLVVKLKEQYGYEQTVSLLKTNTKIQLEQLLNGKGARDND